MALFISKVKGKNRKFIEALNLFICLIPSTVFLWRTTKEALKSFVQSEFQMGIYSFPTWPSKLALPIGFLLLFLCLIFQIYESLITSVGSKGMESTGRCDI
jgi:TRAP-type C4-dicarboxylate transport system permease small subunit